MPQTNYLPTREANLLGWLNNFKARIDLDFAAYGLSEVQKTDFTNATDAFDSAYAVANDPSTRTRANIQAKNTAKKAAIAQARQTVGICQAWPGMTDAKRDLLRITVRDTEPTLIGPPEVMPVLRVASVTGRVLDLELRRQDGTTKQKPVGVRAAWLYTFVGDTPPSDLNDWHFKGGTTKSNPQIVFPDTVAAGTAVWVTALWVNPTDQPGPACAPIKTHISYQGLSEAA